MSNCNVFNNFLKTLEQLSKWNWSLTILSVPLYLYLRQDTLAGVLLHMAYNKLDKIFQENLEITAESIWNSDERRFSTNPGKSRVIFNSWLYSIVQKMHVLVVSVIINNFANKENE